MADQSSYFELFFDEVTSALEAWESELLSLEKKDYSRVDLLKVFRFIHNLKAGSRALDLNQISDFLHLVESFISLTLKEFEQSPSSSENWLPLMTELLEFTQNWFNHLNSNPKFLRGEAEVLEEAQKIEAYLGKVHPDSPVPRRRREDRETADTPGVRRTLPVAVDKLDRVIDLVGEITVNQLDLRRALNSTQDRQSVEFSMEGLDSSLRELREVAMTLRLTTLHQLFGRLERTTREAARNLGKLVDVVIEGDEALLDKQIVDALSESLVHLVRNAVDHGIELPAIREEKGKPPITRILLKAQNMGSHVMIEISDDGKGIDSRVVYNKAIEKGLIASGAVLSEKQKLDLIFMPGFSTASEIGTYSGRGIGMEIVKRTAEALGGELNVITEVGKGTTFRLRIPSNLCIVNALVFTIGGFAYATPYGDVLEVLDIAESKIKHSQLREPILDLREKSIRLINLRDYLIIPTTSPDRALVSPDAMTALVLEIEGSLTGVLIDHILGGQQLFLKAAQGDFRKIPGVMGTSLLSSGEPTLVISLANLVRGLDLKKLSLGQVVNG